MKSVLNKILLIFFLSSTLCSCVDSNYDLDNIDDSGGLSPAFALPIGTIRTQIADFIKGAGIDEDILVETRDTFYVVYGGSMSLSLTSSSFPLFDYVDGDVIYDIPEELTFGFGQGVESIEIDVFKNLESNGSVLRPSNPKVYCTIHNYLGANIDIDINSIKSYGNGEKSAIFKNGASSYSIDVESARVPYDYAEKKEVFDKTNGQMHNLFSISPERISFDFSVDLTIPNDGKQHFIVKDKYVDIDYQVEIPMTFAQGTQLAYADTLDFDLSGEDFVNSLDELTLWIDYENRLRTTVGLDILFLDEYKRVIPNITKEFSMNAAASGGADAQPATGSLELSFNNNEFDDAKKTHYVILKSILKVDGEDEVNIHPSDYINLKLSAYSKINI